MPTPTRTITTVLARWADPDDLDQSFRDSFTPVTVWENVGMVVTTGIDEAIALNRGFAAQYGMASIRVDVLAIAEGGDRVLTERVDHLLDAAGGASPVRTVHGGVRGGGRQDRRPAALLARDFFELAADAVLRQAQGERG